MPANVPHLATRLVDTTLGTLRVQVSGGTGPAVLMWPSLLMTGDLWAGQAARSATAIAWCSSTRPATAAARR